MEMFLYENYGIVIYDLSQGVSPPTSCHSSWGGCAGGGGCCYGLCSQFEENGSAIEQVDTGSAGGGLSDMGLSRQEYLMGQM
jgi:hypothetical protein